MRKLAVSYAISFFIAKHSKSFSEMQLNDEFIKKTSLGNKILR